VHRTIREAAAEFVGTLAVVFVGAGAVIVAGPSGSGLLGVALAYGLVTAVMVTLTWDVSRGHLNPAVTIGLWVVGKIPTVLAGVYVAAQMLGAVAGAVLLRLTVPEPMWRAAHLGAPLLAPDVGAGRGVVLEAILAFFLVFAVFGTWVDERRRFTTASGFLIGLVLTFDVLAAGPLTGAAVSTARAFGPELVSGTWTDWWVYWVGPTAGGVLAAVAYWAAFLREREPATP
jgi:MIP family channel proteins